MKTSPSLARKPLDLQATTLRALTSFPTSTCYYLAKTETKQHETTRLQLNHQALHKTRAQDISLQALPDMRPHGIRVLLDLLDISLEVCHETAVTLDPIACVDPLQVLRDGAVLLQQARLRKDTRTDSANLSRCPLLRLRQWPIVIPRTKCLLVRQTPVWVFTVAARASQPACLACPCQYHSQGRQSCHR